MAFKDRNEEWVAGTRYFLQPNSKSSTPRVWIIWVQGNVITYQWGQLGGAMQQANEMAQGVNIGKKNEISPEGYALYRAKEMCRKKHWEGYIETDSSGTVFMEEPSPSTIDFDNLPLNLCFYKPDNSMGAGITKKANAGQVLYARKANGLMFVISKGSQPAKLYSRKMLRHQDDEAGQDDKTWDRRFGNIQGAADYIMPNNSIMLGELVVIDKHGNEDFKAIQSLTKSLTEEAFTKLVQLENEGKRPAFYCWDIAFWDGKDLVREAPIKDRYELIHEVVDGPHIVPVQYFGDIAFPNPQVAVDYAKEKDWEGFVVVDPEGVYGDKGYNFKGKPDRPGSVCAKLKPEYEDDFVALWNPEAGYGERSTKGRNDQGIKSVSLYQYNSKGEMVYISNVSSGLTDEMKKDWANSNKFPMVWKVIYTERTYVSEGDDTNALTFARFDSVRTDKTVAECINQEL
jgi:hypothetical protein